MKLTTKVILLAFAVCLTCSVYAQKTKKKQTNRTNEKFTPPVIKADTIRDQISIADVIGDSEGIDIADLKEGRIVVEEKQMDRPFVSVEQMPSFPDGEGKMVAFISDSLRYPVSAAEIGIQGRVIIRFVVDAEGEIKDARVLRGIDPSCDREALRIIQSMPKWIPGKQNGKNVPVYYTLPITFRLSNL